MNGLLRCCFSAAAFLGLAACTSTGPTSPEPSASAAPAGRYQADMDAEYVAVVEHFARRRGIVVKWVNPPPRRAVDAEPGNQD